MQEQVKKYVMMWKLTDLSYLGDGINARGASVAAVISTF